MYRYLYWFKIINPDQAYMPVILVTGCATGIGLSLAKLLYLQKSYRVCITARSENFKFQKGNFYSVTLYTKLNSSANTTDGEAWVYVNGERIVGQSNVQFWKSDPELSKISKFMFSTFFGGHEPEWAPKDSHGKYQNVHAVFDNFVVEKGLKVRGTPGQ